MNQIKSLIEVMTRDIKETVGGVFTEETDKIINQFSTNFVEIQDNFNALIQRIDELEKSLKDEFQKVKFLHIKIHHSSRGTTKSSKSWITFRSKVRLHTDTRSAIKTRKRARNSKQRSSS